MALVADAKALAAAGCFAIVLEGVPDEVARMVTDAVDVPTIGIGAGPGCDGQVLVFHDVLGIEDRIAPKFVRRYADLKAGLGRRAGRLRRRRPLRRLPHGGESDPLEPNSALRSKKGYLFFLWEMLHEYSRCARRGA
jgi:hypothetical protein